ncbi:hypothetical protein MLD38_004922 [Melastoma candidum]|uniref:Uncharacterized protein n=1 Tax=Melastoma candidum TaxID=119954 RepID=A0ACB9S6G0_9MYRT|nr:hypothetical protein MLD38_004922 [Melastoma candidum]
MGRSSSRKWVALVTSLSSAAYILLVLLQAPLFSAPCRIGICVTPVEFTSSLMMTSELLPLTAEVVKALLYPGALASALLHGDKLPSYDRLLESYNLGDIDQVPALMDLRRIEILAGSYFMVMGALLSLVKPVRMSFFGTLLVTWGLTKEVLFRRYAYSNSMQAVRIYPTMLLAVASAFFSMRGDARRIIRLCRKRAKNRRSMTSGKEKKIGRRGLT